MKYHTKRNKSIKKNKKQNKKQNKKTKRIIKNTQKPQKRLSLMEINDMQHKRRLVKVSNTKYKNHIIKSELQKKVELQQKRNENERIVTIVEKLLNNFIIFQKKVKYEDDVDEIKDIFESEMCKDNIFNVKKTICGTGSYKVVLLCKENISDCKYVYAFDFKHHPDEDGDEKFMKEGRYKDLAQLDNILSITPIFHKKLYCGYSNAQRVDFMLFPNNGNELFNYLYLSKEGNKLKMGTSYNLWLSFTFLMTTLYSLGMLHKKGYAHRDLKPENMLIGNPNNKDRNFLTVTDYGFVIHKDEPKYDVTGTPEYLTPKISKIYQNIISSSKLRFVDLIEHDLHTIGYNLIQIMVNNVFSGISTKAECDTIIRNCGTNIINSRNIGKSNCKIDAMTFLSCNDKIEGTLGERNKLLSIVQKSDNVPKFPDYAIKLMKSAAITLSAFGFTEHFKDTIEGQHYGINMFKMLSRELKAHNDFNIIRKVINSDVLKVKLNPLIWKQIETI